MGIFPFFPIDNSTRKKHYFFWVEKNRMITKYILTQSMMNFILAIFVLPQKNKHCCEKNIHLIKNQINKQTKYKKNRNFFDDEKKLIFPPTETNILFCFVRIEQNYL